MKPNLKEFQKIYSCELAHQLSTISYNTLGLNTGKKYDTSEYIKEWYKGSVSLR